MKNGILTKVLKTHTNSQYNNLSQHPQRGMHCMATCTQGHSRILSHDVSGTTHPCIFIDDRGRYRNGVAICNAGKSIYKQSLGFIEQKMYF